MCCYTNVRSSLFPYSEQQQHNAAIFCFLCVSSKSELIIADRLLFLEDKTSEPANGGVVQISCSATTRNSCTVATNRFLPRGTILVGQKVNNCNITTNLIHEII